MEEQSVIQRTPASFGDCVPVRVEPRKRARPSPVDQWDNVGLHYFLTQSHSNFEKDELPLVPREPHLV